MRTLAEVLPVEVAIGCTVNCQASAIIYRVLEFMVIINYQAPALKCVLKSKGIQTWNLSKILHDPIFG